MRYIVLMLMLALVVCSVSANIDYPTDDTWVYEGSINTNYGDNKRIRVQGHNYSNKAQRGYLSFNLSGNIGTNVTFAFYINFTEFHAPYNEEYVYLYASNCTFNELDVTWSNITNVCPASSFENYVKLLMNKSATLLESFEGKYFNVTLDHDTLYNLTKETNYLTFMMRYHPENGTGGHDASGIYLSSTEGNYPAYISYNGSNDINITIYDEQTQLKIDDRNITLYIYSDTNTNNYTTPDGNITINILYGNYTIQYNADGYHLREYYFTHSHGQTIDLYLINDSTAISDRIIHTVYDQDGDEAEDVTVKLQRHYPGTNSYITVSMARSNFEGEAILYVELYDVWYRMLYEQDGVLYKTTDPSPFLSTTPTDVVNLEEDEFLSWRLSDDIYANLDFINSSGQMYARYIYTDTSNLVQTGCLRVQRVSAIETVEVCNNCTTSTSATLTCQVDHTLSGEYRATGTIDTNTENSVIPMLTGYYKVYDFVWFGQESLFMAAFFIGSIAMMGAAFAAGSIIFMLIGLIAMVATGFVSGISLGYIYYLVAIGVIIIMIISAGNRR